MNGQGDARMTQDRPTAAQVRQGIDRGKGSDKVAFPDPAAAPLGTDDEAAGHPVSPDQAAAALAAETRSRPDLPQTAPDLTQRDPGTTRFAVVLAVLGVVLVIAVLLLRG